ncbi:MAG: S41 family peptidase [Bdellovibrionales bacterium]|nr:S41 family peptidase [Bdellovibrionales bacterium]
MRKFFWVLLPAFGAGVWALPALTAEVSNEKYDGIALFGRVINFVEKQYVEKVSTRDLVYGAIKGMLEALDPHSNFLPPDIYKQLKSDTSGKFGGVGVEVWVPKDGVLTVVNPMEDTPAWRAGIKSGDRIIKIDGTSTKGMSMVEVNSRMRGEPGSKIHITVQRDGAAQPLDFEVRRETINIRSVKHEMLTGKVGWVKVNQFQEKSAREIGAAIKDMESKGKLSGLILDLRNNPGGLLDEAVETANLFVDSGVIVSTIGRDPGDKEVRSAKSGIARLDFPMVVLINGGSASAAEIVAGALKDHKRAIVAGQKSFGKGSVQTVIPLGDDVGLKLTIARYYTPSGTSIQATGIEPDLLLDDLDATALKRLRKKLRHGSEADLKNALANDGAGRVKRREKDGSDAEEMEDSPRPLDPKTDYQVQQALNLLKSSTFFRQVPKT